MMFTNEFELGATITTVLDETGEHPDVQMIIEDEGVFIRQFPKQDNRPADVIFMSHKMFHDMLAALKQEEGFFVTEYKKSP